MRILLPFILFFIVFKTHAQVQSYSASAMTIEQYNAIKKLQFKDLEKETYLKFENGFIADRYEMKPAYIFNFSDGAERRIYLYKISDLQKNDMGLLAVYKNLKTGKIINTCIPSTAVDKKIWGMYIDDLKESDKAESGFGPTTTFVLSKELMEKSSSGPAQESSSGVEDDYEFCFPSNSLVTLASGEQKAICDIRKGDIVKCADINSKKISTTKVLDVISHHSKTYEITRLKLFPVNTGSAFVNTEPVMDESIEATANHPVLTSRGKKRISEIIPGDIMYVWNSKTSEFDQFSVTEKATSRYVDTVYNLRTVNNNYLVNSTIVFKK